MADKADFEWGYRCLEELVASCPEQRAVIHGDLLAGNVLAEGGRITAVLDWGNSLAGDALYDLAWLLFWSPWHPGLDARRVREMAADLHGGPDLLARLRCYQVHIGLDGQQYNAFTGRWSELALTAARTREICD